MAFPSRAEFIWPFSSGTVCTCCWNFGALCAAVLEQAAAELVTVEPAAG